ncbi:MAG: YncE family protein [Acidimicrobiales bacterium]|nr:YncE family protein [Acidimicrobiales bacterium]
MNILNTSRDVKLRSGDPYRQIIFWKKVSILLVLLMAAILIFETFKTPLPDSAATNGTNGDLPSVGITSPKAPSGSVTGTSGPVTIPTLPNQGNTLWVVSPKCQCIQLRYYQTGQPSSPRISVPAGPISMIDDPTGLQQYILSQDASSISIINLLNGKITRTLNISDSPNSMWINYAQTTLFVTSSKNNTLSSLSLSGLKPGFTVAAGPNPTSVVANASGTIAYVADAGNDTVLPIDLTSKPPKPLTPIPVGKDPTSLYLDPTTNEVVYVVNHDSGTISMIGLPSNRVIATVNVGGLPDSISVDPYTQTAYVAISNEGVIVPINLFDVVAGSPIDVGPDPTTVTAGIQGSHIFVTLGGNDTGVYFDPKNPNTKVVYQLPPGVVFVSYFVPAPPR